MLGIFLWYWIGKAFYTLAGNHDKNKWGFAILGIAAYLGGTFVAGIIFAFTDELAGTSILEAHNVLINLMALPFGAAACWGLYRYLEHRWSNATTIPTAANEDILDADLINTDAR